MSAVDALGLRLLDVALLEGDFTLRSGKRSRWYLDKYRFETDPVLLRELGERLAEATSDAEPDAVRLACPMLGAVVLDELIGLVLPDVLIEPQVRLIDVWVRWPRVVLEHGGRE